MPNGNLGLATEFASEEINHELRVKKSIGILDAVLLAIGFTTTNLQHFITPVAEGGIGLSLAGEGAIAASLVTLGVSTLAIGGVVTYYVIQLVNQSAQEVQDLIEKQKALEEKQIIFFARLIYLRRLMEERSLHQLNDFLKEYLGLQEEAARALADTVENIYREKKGFFQVICQRNKHEESEEKAIQHYFVENEVHYLPRIQQGLSHLYAHRPPVAKNWKPELIGLFTGFISFMGMSSGFIGTYYSVVSLAIGMASVSFAVPVLGWVIFAASILFGLAVGLVVRYYTDKSIKRDEAMESMQRQETTLNESLAKIHEFEIKVLTDRESKPSLPRSRSWSGTLFGHHKSHDTIPEAEFKKQTLS